MSTASGATFENVVDGSTITFTGSSTAGSAVIGNRLGAGTISFEGNSTAGGAGIANESPNGPGLIIFTDTSKAGNAVITNYTANSTIAFGDSSSAENATIITNSGGIINFENTSEAGSATITTNSGGTTTFTDSSNAEASKLTINSGGHLAFDSGATAGTATIMNAGTTDFFNTSTAGNSNITTSSDGVTTFHDSALGGTATLTIDSGGEVDFRGSSSAQNATLKNFGALTPSGLPGGLNFFGSSTAANARIITHSGAVTTFNDMSDGGSATIKTLGGANGAKTEFFDSSNGDLARFITRSGGEVDISTLSAAGMTSGSIQGAGDYFLGSKELTTGLNGRSTTVRGVISDLGGAVSGTGGSLIKAGSGTLTLSGTNTYSGGTTISGGTLQLGNGGTTGSILGDVTDNGTLAFNRSDTVIFPGDISGNGNLEQIGSGTTILTANNTYSGGTTISSGTLQLGNGGTTGSILGDVTDNGTLAFNRSDTAIFPGEISGNGNLEQIGPGRTILTANNTYTGGTTISGGTLQLGNGGTTGSILGDVTDNGTLAFSRSDTVIFPGEISGGGSLEQIGPGTTILTANNTYTGDTTISGGTLQLGNGGTTGDISTVGKVILDGGTLTFNHSGNPKRIFPNLITGSGDVVKLGSDTLELTGINNYTGSTMINGGILVAGGGITVAGQGLTSFAFGNSNVFLNNATLRAPTLDPEIINVGGNYTQSSSGTLELGVAGVLGNYDRVQAGGTATVGGTLSVFSLGGFAPANGNAFAVVRGAAGRTGTYGTINDFLNLNHLQRVDIYAANAVVLLYIAPTIPPVEPPSPPPVIPPPPAPGPTPAPTPPPAPPPINEQDPGVVIPPVIPGEPLPDPFVLQLVAPTVGELTALYEISFSGANTQRFSLDNRMLELQQTIFPMPQVQAPPPTTKELTKEGPGKEEVPPPAQPGPRWGIWGNGYGDWVNLDSTDVAKGYNFTTGGMSAGIDYLITDHLAVGIFGGYSHTSTDLKPGSIDVDTGRGGIYATYFDQGWWVNAAAWGGGNSYSTSRGGLEGTANGDTSGWEFSTLGEAGYNFHLSALPALNIGPTVALQFTRVGYDGYTEHGSLVPLTIHSGNQNSLRSDVGIQGTYTFHIGKIAVMPYLRAAWEREYKYTDLPISFGASLFPGVSVTTHGPNEGRNSAIVNAGFGVQWTQRLSTFIEYQGQLGRSNYDANGVNFTISYAW
jgi:outer membrane autotransporter protein